MRRQSGGVGTLRTATAMIVAAVMLTGFDKPANASAPQLESARVVVPAMVSFSVPNISVVTIATPTPARVSFNQAQLLPFHVIRISVKADANLTSAGGTSVPASNVAWTTSGVMNGVGINGVLSTASYIPVFEGQVGKSTGRVDLTWTLSMPAGTVRAETLQTTLRWKFESITP
jgi:hypothetical protein